MGINMPEKESEGTMFENALKSYPSEKVVEKDDSREWLSNAWQQYIDGNICPTGNIKTNKRPTSEEYYLQIAEVVAARGTCLRRRFGAIIVKDDVIISTGYVGAPRKRMNCCDRGTCFRMEHNIPSGQRYELCRSVHAEMNAIINADPIKRKDARMYLVGIENDKSYTEADCCSMCKRMIINAGISEVVFRTADGSIRVIKVQEWVDNDDSLTIHEGY